MQNPVKSHQVPLRPTQAMQVGAGGKIMNESNNPKSLVACMFADPKKSALVKVRGVVLLAVLLIADFPAMAPAQSLSCPGIHVKVLNIRNNVGTVACALFESPVGFPVEFLRYATNIMVIKIRETKARFAFLDIPPGTYALAVVHDENMNGKLDTNWLGIPAEGYGFSNDAKALLSAPSFSAASFLYDGKDMELTISMLY